MKSKTRFRVSMHWQREKGREVSHRGKGAEIRWRDTMKYILKIQWNTNWRDTMKYKYRNTVKKYVSYRGREQKDILSLLDGTFEFQLDMIEFKCTWTGIFKLLLAWVGVLAQDSKTQGGAFTKPPSSWNQTLVEVKRNDLQSLWALSPIMFGQRHQI